MIVTASAALSFIAHIDPNATLPDACAAIRSAVTCERTVKAAATLPWCAVPTRIGKLVFQGAYVTDVWPRETVVSRGPMGTGA